SSRPRLASKCKSNISCPGADARRAVDLMPSDGWFKAVGPRVAISPSAVRTRPSSQLKVQRAWFALLQGVAVFGEVQHIEQALALLQALQDLPGAVPGTTVTRR